MSNYVAFNARLQAQCLSNVATILQTPVDETALMARASSLLREVAHADVSFLPTELVQLEDVVSRLGHAVPVDLDHTDRAAAVLEVAARAYEVATQEFLVGAVIEAIAEPSIDFSAPIVRVGEDVVALDARRGNSALVVRVGRDGRVERDWLVSEGEDCHVLDDVLDQALRRRGIDFDLIVEDHHGGRLDRARLFGPALARDPGDPARGAVLDAEHPTTITTIPTAAATEPLRTPRRTVRRKA